EPRRPRARCARRHRPAAGRRGEAAADAVEPAGPHREAVRAAGRPRRAAVDVLRPLLRPRGGPRDGGHLRLRRDGVGGGRKRQRVGGAVPPREVRDRRPGPPGQLRRPLHCWGGGVMDLLPAIDLIDGGAVRLVQGDFGRQADYGDPLDLARRYLAAGARWVHVVDLDAARTGSPVNRPVVKAIAAEAAEHGAKVQTGGGVRTAGDVDDLLGAGVARVVLGTAAIEDPSLAVATAEAHPGQVAVGLDYRRRDDGELEAASRGWLEGSGRTVAGLLADLAAAPVGAVVVTAIDRDGTLAGPDTDGLAAVLRSTSLPVVASG